MALMCLARCVTVVWIFSGKAYLTRRNNPIEPGRASRGQTAARQATMAVQRPHSDMMESIPCCEEESRQLYLMSERSICKPTEAFQIV